MTYIKRYLMYTYGTKYPFDDNYTLELVELVDGEFLLILIQEIKVI